MQILIQAKKSAADPEIRAYAQAKLEKLARHFEHVLEARLELTTEKNKSLESLKVAELTVHVAGRTGNILKAVQSAEHMNEAVDLVIDKMDRQIRDHKERLKDHRAGKNGTGQASRSSTNVRPWNGVAKVKRFKLKPTTVEQASQEMDQLGHSFFVFLNEDTHELNVLYQRHDETLGVVEADLS
ncbi:MAG TPA: ribosome-associated translation inhibitor RaiA [Candidatus Dormibacteraeota bacterium]|nr:ribosome-associated translation inhibitor RaiA [Candidatus Dormibacteraeota bacterium]